MDEGTFGGRPTGSRPAGSRPNPNRPGNPAPRGARPRPVDPEHVKARTEAALAGTRHRIEWAFYILLLPLFLLTGRLVYLQGVRGGQETADFIKEKKQILPARRADILAADGTAMAVTLDEYSVTANPRAVRQKEKMARLMAEYLGGDKDEYLVLLNKTEKPDGRPNHYVRLARHVDETRVEKLKKRMGPPGHKEKTPAKLARKKFWEAIAFEATPRRTYPMGDFASQVIGFTTAEGKGVSGLESAFNKDLAGKPGEVISQVDSHNRPIPGFVEKWNQPENGQTIVTTIEPEIQADADTALRDMVAKYKPNFAVAIVMRPQTGEIVAMSTAPSFDLNKRPKNIAELASNRATQFAYEPGSTFKIITAAAAVENVPNWQSHSFYCNGVQLVGKHNMHCWVNSTSARRHGDEDLSRSIRDSCNFGVYGFARLMGAPTLLEYAKNFGLTERVDGKGLGGPAGYLARKPQTWSQEQLANFSFGQGMMITPLQLARVTSVIANDGVMMKPMLVKEIRDEQGNVQQVIKPEIDHRVIKAETARIVSEMMVRVITEGSASKFAWVPGYHAAGKTGSAQKADGPRGYADGKFISSLVGFVPAKQPKYVIVVMADEPRGSHWGSEVCGPAWGTIAAKAMLHLRLRDGAAAPAPDMSLLNPPKKKEIS